MFGVGDSVPANFRSLTSLSLMRFKEAFRLSTFTHTYTHFSESKMMV